MGTETLVNDNLDAGKSHVGGLRKRLVDLVFCLPVVAIATPVLAVSAAVILISDGRPVLYRQTRVGLHGRHFALFKLRTMKRDADKHALGTVSIAGDPRLIPCGRLIRALKIDELPQLLNVMIGDMSLVGPRPTVDVDVERMTERQKGRHAALPGITGLAQINGNASLLWPERIEYDLRYIKSYSVLQDLWILAQTVWIFLSGRADTPPADGDEWGEHTNSSQENKSGKQDV